MRRNLINAAKLAAYHAGMFSLWSTKRLSSTLTVIMYHRVLPQAHAHRLASVDEYVISDGDFAASLDVVERLFQPVSPSQLIDFLDGQADLPPRAALITFDDGWLDTLTVAGPELRRRALPSIVFVPPTIFDGVGPFWQERLVYTIRSGTACKERLGLLARTAGVDLSTTASTPELMRQVIAKLTDMSATRRGDIIGASIGDTVADGTRHFLARQELSLLRECGIEIGCHGLTHEALTMVDDAYDELVRSRASLSTMIGAPVTMMSFPQGRYDGDVAAQAVAAGFRAIFTSDSVINRLPPAPAHAALFGRIGVYPDQAGKGEVADSLTGRPVQSVRVLSEQPQRLIREGASRRTAGESLRVPAG